MITIHRSNYFCNEPERRIEICCGFGLFFFGFGFFSLNVDDDLIMNSTGRQIRKSVIVNTHALFISPFT